MTGVSQQGDVLLCQTEDDGDIAIQDGLFAMTPGLETMAYLCLFGGNREDDGNTDNPLQWWANFTEPDVARQYRSETQHLLQGLPATTGNLQRLKAAVERDLAVLVSEQIASSVEVSVSIPQLNWVRIAVLIKNDDSDDTQLEFNLNWKANFV